MGKQEVMESIEGTGIVAIVRGTKPHEILEIAGALYEGGIRVIEVACNTPGYLDMIKALVTDFGSKMVIGAGTVLNADAARKVIQAGAEFILAPNLDEEVVTTAMKLGKAVVPGVATPTEMMNANKLGVETVKLFPAGALGARYLKEVKGPLNHMKFMPVGGINQDNIPDFVKAGAAAFGIGSELVDKVAVARCDFAEITRRAQTYLAIFKQAKQGVEP